MRMDEGDQPDHQGYRTTQLLRKPFIEASIMALKKTHRPKDVRNTIEEIKDDETYSKQTLGALLKVAPTKFKQTNIDAHEADQLEDEKWMDRLNRVVAKHDKMEAEKLRKEAVKWKNELLNSHDLHDGTFWHPIQHLIIQLDDDLEFTILGRREKRSDATIPLTKADLTRIEEMGLVDHLDPQYKIKLGIK
jgi:hypothetical protein